MSAKPIDRLEAQMEALIEDVFTRLFRPTTTMRDLAILLLRVMAEKANVRQLRMTRAQLLQMPTSSSCIPTTWTGCVQQSPDLLGSIPGTARRAGE